MADVMTELDDTTFSNDLAFEYDISLEEAVKPEDLPDNRYWAVVTKADKRKSNTTGRDQLVLAHLIKPEEYPADYPTEHNPEGITVTSYSQDVGCNTRGKHNMRKIAEAYKVPLGSTINAADFEGKRVLIEITTVSRDDGNTVTWMKGLPSKVE